MDQKESSSDCEKQGRLWRDWEAGWGSQGEGEGRGGNCPQRRTTETWNERKSFQGYMGPVGRKPLPRASWHRAVFKVLAVSPKREAPVSGS